MTAIFNPNRRRLLPGIVPLTATSALAQAGLLPKPAINDLDILRQHNPLLFDFTLKRLLN